jgi:hypothetical protein
MFVQNTKGSKLHSICYSIYFSPFFILILQRIKPLAFHSCETAPNATKIWTSFPGLERRKNLFSSHIQIFVQLRSVRWRGHAPKREEKNTSMVWFLLLTEYINRTAILATTGVQSQLWYKRAINHSHPLDLHAHQSLPCYILLCIFELRVSFLLYLPNEQTGVIAFSGMVTASISCLMFVASLVSPTTGRCTVFSWQRLKLCTRGGKIWAISVQGSRWKSFCPILRSTEK